MAHVNRNCDAAEGRAADTCVVDLVLPLPETALTAVLVEGESDRQAVLATAAGAGRDLDAEGVIVVAMGGATNVEKFARWLGRDRGFDLVALCDAGEVDHFTRVLARDEVFVCIDDLEHELLDLLSADEMIAFIEDQGELKTFRTFQKQPAQRDRSLDEHFHRFCGIRSGRKVRYARGLAGILSPDRIPTPLRDLLDRV